MAGNRTGDGTVRAALSERGDDLYQTPPEAVRSFLKVETPPRLLWEPACGPSAIARELRAANYDVLATDLVDYDSDDQDGAGLDFLFPYFDCGWFPFEPQGIVTNPPFKNADEFVLRALDRVPYVAMLLRLAFMESEKRRNVLDDAPLARVHVYRKRLPMMHREGFDGPKNGNSGMAFAWFVWDRDHEGPTTLHRLSWEK